ncbi:MAG: hypothetical protein PHE41_03570, partial [Eubacteriales bacterium]|nr:hypothetical protein [Eubacteriales bacterium]
MHSFTGLPELHPAQQRLKRAYTNSDTKTLDLPELHPAQQGLKLAVSNALLSWNLASRTTSSTTRIETAYYSTHFLLHSRFQ